MVSEKMMHASLRMLLAMLGSLFTMRSVSFNLQLKVAMSAAPNQWVLQKLVKVPKVQGGEQQPIKMPHNDCVVDRPS